MDTNDLRKIDCIIGIDPDCEKSGLAILYHHDRKLLIGSYHFPKLIDVVREFNNAYNLVVVVEAGWIRQAHWHLTANDTKRSAASKGNAVGRNHETGRKIVEMLKHYHINVVEQPPYNKIWKGSDRKITHKELVELLDNNNFAYLFKKTNQEERDAVLLALGYSNIPLIKKV